MELNILTICYLLASVTFIVGLKMLSHPASARKGNLIAAFGMAVAILATLFLYKDENGNALHNYGWIITGIIIGSAIGLVTAKKVKMTAMPEMVSAFNGMGGLCAALVSIVEFDHLTTNNINELTGNNESLLVIIAGSIIGCVSFAGSMIAWGKLNGKIKDFHFKNQHFYNIGLLLLILSVSVFVIANFSADTYAWYYLIPVLSLVYGVLFVMPIGGADMPVVISLLNSFTGVAAACGGFLYNNKVMLTGGILVGAAGTLLTILMCKAMNRSLKNVLIGSFGVQTKSSSSEQINGSFKEISIADAAMALSYARKVIIVPGYGLAVAQAQHVAHELEKLLEEKGVEVTYAIHPVAGRMPGHMNVLLAEADVPYEKLQEMEEANEQFKNTDVVLVLGANDVVNPAAKNDPASPIYGMPVLNVEDAKMVIVNKRSMKPGYAGIENELFYHPSTSMLFGDGKSVLQQLVQQVKEV